MIKYGIRRWGQQTPPLCGQCGQPRQRIWRPHPFPMPVGYGRGVWLQEDCGCITAARSERRQQLQAAVGLRWEDPLPPALRQHTFANFKVGAYNREGYDICGKFAAKFPKIKSGEGLFLYGHSGVGKTHLACAILNQLKEDHWTAFAHVPTLLDQLRRQAVTLDPLIRVQLLVLDDLGSERTTDWALEQLLVILDGRMNHNRSTILTANYDSEQLAQLDRIVGMRLASRITGQHLPVLLQGPDWRQQRYK